MGALKRSRAALRRIAEIPRVNPPITGKMRLFVRALCPLLFPWKVSSTNTTPRAMENKPIQFWGERISLRSNEASKGRVHGVYGEDGAVD